MMTVLVAGSFNPLIVEPNWLQSEGLLGALDLETARTSEETLISPEVSTIEFDRFRVETLRDRLLVATRAETETPAQVFEFVYGILTRLGHTPIRSFSYHYAWHFKLPAGRWDELQSRLWQPTNWLPMLDTPELFSIVVEGLRTDGLPGEIAITIEPSALEGFEGFFSYTDQVTTTIDEDPVSASSVLETLEEVWAESENRAASAYFAFLGDAE